MIKNMQQKPRNKCADVTRFRNTNLISACLLGCLHMLPLPLTMSREKLSCTCAESEFYIIKKSFLRLQTTTNDTKYL